MKTGRGSFGAVLGAVCLFLGGLGLAACGGSDEGGGDFCSVWVAKQRDCGVLGKGKTNCVNYGDSAESCEIACASSASCSAFKAHTCGLPGGDELSACLASCVGLEQVTCADGSVLSGFVRCNGLADCGETDDTDEAGCTRTGFKCRTADQFVDSSLRCDDHQDCLDGSDETPDCKFTAKCASGKAIRAGSVCDGVTDCADGSDEPVECAPLVCPDI